MDEYYLSKEDWDTIVELGVGDHKDVKMSAATKTSFTKKYVGAQFPRRPSDWLPLDIMHLNTLFHSTKLRILERYRRSSREGPLPTLRKLS